jgi:integrase
MTTGWRGSVYARGRKLWLRFKLDGKWIDRSSGLDVGQEQKAHALLRRIREKSAAGEALGDVDLGPLTVARYAATWLETRKLNVASWKSDDGHLRMHILPAIGALRMEDVRPRQIADLLDASRRDGAAPRSIRNIYSTCRSLFRDATFADLIPASPAILTKQHIGKVRDRDPEWRLGAVFARAELEALISDDKVPVTRRLLWAFFALTGVRHGEMAGLRWRHVDLDVEPLGRIVVATSYDTGRTKTGAERRVPIHPVLAAMLAEWRLKGWAGVQGRAPGPDDLVFPSERGRMRHKSNTLRFLGVDLDALKLRHRRVHDLRRTFITLAREDGAERDVLRLVTHAPSSDVIDLYTSVQWERRCAEVAKIRLKRRKSAKILTLTPSLAAAALLHSRRAANDDAGLPSEAPGNRTRNHRLKRPMLCQLS